MSKRRPRSRSQEEHEFRISGDILSGQIRDRDAGAAVTAAQQKADADQKPTASLFVKRGAVWRHAGEAKLRPGEPVFVKRPTGAWEAVGVVDATGGVPPPEMIL